MSKIIQIIPFRRQRPDGVGDYGSQIATAWQQFDGTRTVFLAATPKDFDGDCADGHETYYLPSQSSKALMLALKKLLEPNDRIILHMSAYGFQKRAIPLWLLAGIKQLKTADPNRFLLSVFHEICASSSKPWQSSFWLSSAQKYIAKEIFKLSDAMLTPCESYVKQLGQMCPEVAIAKRNLPVFSTIGDPEISNTPMVDRKGQRKLAIFGNRNSRISLYNRYHPALINLCERLDIPEIIDIGSPDKAIPTHLNTISVRSTGILSASHVRQELMACQYGAIAYDATRLGKSTILAAYAAHGLNVICFDNHFQASEGLENKTHLIIANDFLDDQQIKQLQHCGKNLHQWYKPHSLEQTVLTFNSLMNFAS